MAFRQLIEDYFLTFYSSLTNLFDRSRLKKACYLISAIICGILLGIILAVFLSLGRITQIIAIVLFILMFLGHVVAIIILFRSPKRPPSRYLIYYTASFLIHQGAVIIGIITWSLIVFNKGHCTYSNNDTSDACFLTSVMFLIGSVFFAFGAVHGPIIKWKIEKEVDNGINERQRQKAESQLDDESPTRNSELDLRSKEDDSETTSIDYQHLEPEYPAPLQPYDLVCGPEDRSPPLYIP